jgi:dTDP-4-amino-4,6-dideoxygalactose transaminase
MKPYQDSSIRKDDLSVTEKVIQEIVTLPIYPQMSPDDLGYMVDSISDTISEME